MPCKILLRATFYCMLRPNGAINCNALCVWGGGGLGHNLLMHFSSLGSSKLEITSKRGC